LRKEKEIVALAILICLTLTSIQTVLADGTETCPSNGSPCAIWGPGIAPSGNSKSFSPFDADFIHIYETSVTLGKDVSGVETYTFKITLLDTPTNWMAATGWNPTFVAPHEHTQLSYVGYNWMLRDASGHFLGFVHVGWHLGTIVVFVGICLPGANAHIGCLDSVGMGAGLGFQANYLTQTPTFTYGYHGTVSLAILKTDLDNLFLNAGFTTVPGQWRALAAACPQAASTGEACTGYATYPATDLPT
jgi:hypothetical protein